MKLKLKRYEFHIARTHGHLSIEDQPFCDTLEDTVRKGEKVYGKTAIPAGTYEVKLTYSNRFKKVMPQLMNVPGFEGIRIHSGNKEDDTEGCILVGKRDGDQVISSRVTYADLLETLEEVIKNEKVFIEIE